jgi:hypothetical protein
VHMTKNWTHTHCIHTPTHTHTHTSCTQKAYRRRGRKARSSTRSREEVRIDSLAQQAHPFVLHLNGVHRYGERYVGSDDLELELGESFATLTDPKQIEWKLLGHLAHVLLSFHLLLQ